MSPRLGRTPMRALRIGLIVFTSILQITICASAEPVFENQLVDVGAPPRSIAAGDINGDGRDDLIVALPDEDDFLILLSDSTSPTGFSESSLTAAEIPDRATLADIDLDGDLDIIAGFLIDGGVQVLVNDSTGAFSATQDLMLGGIPHILDFADVNSDGFPDLVFAFDDNLGISLNDGTGSFLRPISQPTHNGPFSIAWVDSGDIDGDGALDIIAANESQKTIYFVSALQNGAQLTPVAELSTIAEPRGIACVDVNADGVAEIATVQRGPSPSVVLRMVTHPLNTAYAIPPDNTLASGASSAITMDVNSDGLTDIVTIGGFANHYFLGNASGFGLPAPMSIASVLPLALVADLNGDMNADLVSFSTFEPRTSLLIARGCGDGRFDSRPPYAALGARHFTAGDVNGDGVSDIVTSDPEGIKLRLAIGGSYLPPILISDSGANRIPFVADVDLDGLPDVVTVGDSGSIDIHFGEGAFQFTKISLVPDLSDTFSFADVADLDHDGLNDLVVATRSNVIAIRAGLGSRAFGPSEVLDLTSLASNTVIKGIAHADGTADGFADLFVTTESDTPGAARLVLLENDGFGGFNGLFEYDCGENLTAPVIEDLDNDGHIDVIVASEEDDSVTLLWSEPGEGFRGPQFLTTGFSSNTETDYLGVGDLDHDGDDDIVIAREPSTLDVWLNDGRGRFHKRGSFPFAPSDYFVRTLQIVDMTGDGHADAVIGVEFEDVIIVAPGDGDGAFSTPIHFPLPSNSSVRHSLKADWDGDSAEEVLLIDGGDFYLLDYDPVLLSPVLSFQDTLSASLQQFFSLIPDSSVALDANNDGDMDLCLIQDSVPFRVITVLNSGTGLTGGTIVQSPESPLRLHTIVGGDLNNDGAVDLLGFRIDNTTDGPDSMFPLFGDNSGSFVGTLEFATAVGNVIPPQRRDLTLGDMNGDGALDLVTTMRAKSLGVWLGRGDGSFEDGKDTETATRNEIVLAVSDFNLDGRLDVTALVEWFGSGQGAEVYFGASSGQFGVTHDANVGLRPSSVAGVDANDDATIDIAIALRDESRVAIFELENDRALGYRRDSATAHVPVFLTSFDIDFDGDRDLTAGSIGSNSGRPDEYYSLILNHRRSHVAGDLNMTGLVDGADLAILLAQWGSDGPADLNEDGIVDGIDLAQMLSVWGLKSNASTPCD